MSQPQSDNAYDILGAARDADGNALRRAFRLLALKHHPDAVPPKEKEEAALCFARINRAYELLRDPEKRRRYDRQLARGVLPDLSEEVGAVALPNLAEILGEIQSLQIDVDVDDVTLRMSNELRDLLRDHLIEVSFREQVCDVLPIARLVRARGFNWTWRRLSEAWLVVTNLRIFLLMEFTHRTTSGSGAVHNTDAYLRAFSFLSLTSLPLWERGRVFPSYLIELADEKAGYTLELSRPGFTRLLLVANAHRVPVRVRHTGGRIREYLRAFLISLGVMLLALLVAGAWARLRSSASGEWTDDSPIRARAEGTVAVCLPMLLFTWLALRVHCAWGIGRAEEVVGPLSVDFADGPADQTPVFPPPEARAAAVTESPPLGRDVPETPSSASVLQVEIPEAVRDVLGAGSSPLEVDVPETVRQAAIVPPASPPAEQ